MQWWNNSNSVQDDENFILRNFELLRQVKMPAMQDNICKFYCGDPVLSIAKNYSKQTIILNCVDAVVSQNGGKALKFSAKQDITKIEVCLCVYHTYVHMCARITFTGSST